MRTLLLGSHELGWSPMLGSACGGETMGEGIVKGGWSICYKSHTCVRRIRWLGSATLVSVTLNCWSSSGTWFAVMKTEKVAEVAPVHEGGVRGGGRMEGEMEGWRGMEGDGGEGVKEHKSTHKARIMVSCGCILIYHTVTGRVLLP